MPETAKTCFVIGPIGEPLTEAYSRALRMLEQVIIPAIAPLGYVVVRGDQIETSGIVQMQIAAQLLQADLVIADLTGANPNVYYELGVRHTLGKACIQLLPVGERLPFDVAPMRTIIIDDRTTDGVRHGITAIQAQARYITVPLLTPVSLLVNVTTSVRDHALLAAASSIGSMAEPADTPSPILSTPTRHDSQPTVSPVVIDDSVFFWESLDELDHFGTPEKISEVLSGLLTRVATRPTISAPDANGIRVIKSRAAAMDGMTLPGIRLAYILDKDRVVVLHASADDDPLADGACGADI